MKQKHYFLIFIISLIFTVSILLLLVFSQQLQSESLLQDRVYYILLLLMGIFSAISLFGFLKSSTAAVRGGTYGTKIQVGGPAAFAIIVVIGGFYLIPRDYSFDVTVRAIDEVGRTVYSNRKAKVALNLATGKREADFTANGEAVIKGVPSRFLNSKAQILVDIYYYDQLDVSQKYTLSKDVVEIKMKDNMGTTTGILNKKRANLMVANLLLPFRLISNDLEVGDHDLSQYYSSKFKQKVRTFDFDKIIQFTAQEYDQLCGILIENSPESLSVNGKTYKELINQTSIRFKRDVGMISQIDSEGMDPEIQRDLIGLANSNFVSIAAAISPGASASEYLHEGFWNDFSDAIKELKEANHINLFVQFSGAF